MRPAIIRTVTLAVLATATLTGCRADDPGHAAQPTASPSFAAQSYDDIRGAAMDAMKSLRSMHYSQTAPNTYVPDGFESGEMVAVDLGIDGEGGCAGTVTIDGVPTQMRIVNKATYLKASKRFWLKIARIQDVRIVDAIADQWALMPKRFTGFDDYCDLDKALLVLEEDDSVRNQTVGATVDAGGQPAVELFSYTSLGPLTELVSVEEPHYFLTVTLEGGFVAGTRVAYSEFDAVTPVQVPPAGEIVDLDKISS